MMSAARNSFFFFFVRANSIPNKGIVNMIVLLQSFFWKEKENEESF